MSGFETKRLPVAPYATALDGSDVCASLELDGGGLAHFELGPGQTSVAEVHRTVGEIWYFLSGRGEMWRKFGDQETVESVDAGVCLTIPVRTRFQMRSFGYEPLAAIGVTVPPWPGEGEGVEGKWEPTMAAGTGAAS
jgi:mannose-6-phosphate isomerase-like protein (cupin superfamily)